MESGKQYDSDEDGSMLKAPHPPKWNDVEKNYNYVPSDCNSRKRKIITESENSEHLSSETMLVPKRENSTSFCADADQQSTELYGLKQEFLNSLGIRLPLAQWVYVVNFRCDKTELKDVFELAGHVIICSVVAIREKYANIMFSHPLEAVQAISMFNGQTLYGMKLKVTMINPPSDTIILPKGLKDIGPGLGFNGRPLRDIVKHYKKYTKHQISLVDASLFRRQSDDDDEKELLDSKSKDLDTKSKDSEEKSNALNRQKYFKITNVEDLPGKDTVQETNVPENQSKKLRRDELDEGSSSDEESADVRIVSNLSAKLKETNKALENKTLSKDPRLGVSSIQTIGTIRHATAAYNNTRPQNYQPPMSQPTGLQFRPNQLPGNTGPTVPMGPSGLVPFRPSGPGIAPVGTNVPMMAPVGSNGPMMTPVGPNSTMAPLRPNGPMGPFGPGPVGPPAGVMSSVGPPGPFVPFRPPGPNVTPIMQGPNPGLGPHPMIRGNAPITAVPNQAMPNNDVITLQFRNLPPSTTFPLLCEKMSQCGQVLSLQLTTPGCAVARFAHRLHAERCFQFFNGKCIDGCVIEVRFA